MLERPVGLVEKLLDPVVDLAWLEAKLVGEIRDGFLAIQVSPDNVGLLGWRVETIGVSSFFGRQLVTFFRGKMN